MEDIEDLIIRLRLEANDAQARLQQVIAVNCPGTHAPVQHRDGHEPWCSYCGRSYRGYLIKEIR